MKRRTKRKEATFESIDRMVVSEADIYGVDGALDVWTIRPVVEETVAFVVRLHALLDLNPSQRAQLVRAIVDGLYPFAEPDPRTVVRWGGKPFARPRGRRRRRRR